MRAATKATSGDGEAAEGDEERSALVRAGRDGQAAAPEVREDVRDDELDARRRALTLVVPAPVAPSEVAGVYVSSAVAGVVPRFASVSSVV